MKKPKISSTLYAAVTALTLLTIGTLASSADPASERLSPASGFASIEEEAARSAALFVEAGKVLQHPRCVNCHPAGDYPLQGEDGRPHEPPVRRGRLDFGAAAMQCETCHMEANFDPGNMPGDPAWHLAPIEAAWEGRTLAQICEQLKDPERNGDRDLEDIARHMEEDPLVAWAWAPGAGRRPAPGSQKAFGELIREWIEAGAVCPGELGGGAP